MIGYAVLASLLAILVAVIVLSGSVKIDIWLRRVSGGRYRWIP